VSLPCPVVDEDPANGDVVLPVHSDATSVNLVSVSTDPHAWADASAQTVLGGSIVLRSAPLDPLVPPPPGAPPFVIERLRLDISSLNSTQISVDHGGPFHLSSGETLDIENPTIRVQAPVSLIHKSDSYYAIPSGTTIHTCATINGKAWHGSAQLSAELLLSWQPAESINGSAYPPFVDLQPLGLPMALRADDAQCTAFDLWVAGLVVFEPAAALDAGPG
jgi:hypothetical protein